MLHGHQTNHQLFIKFQKLILKAVNFYKIKQNPYHLPIKFEHFPILLYRGDQIFFKMAAIINPS